jgi:tetratricopeptide (TPR) repeat protein
MSWRDLIPKSTTSPETMEALNPVISGQRLFNEGRYPEAEAMYRESLKQFPPKSGGRVLIYNKLGVLYETIGDFRRALDSYGKGVQEGALTPFTYQRLCFLHLEADRLPLAMDYAQQGIRALKKARTNIPQEIYFWFVFQKLKRKINRRMRLSTRPKR